MGWFDLLPNLLSAGRTIIIKKALPHIELSKKRSISLNEILICKMAAASEDARSVVVVRSPSSPGLVQGLGPDLPFVPIPLFTQ